ncbi:START domain-containing protein [Taibaiella koreensis]|uniref:START domain-containing protein n=1 Tax=Taibaiella koreensis TaxID=1268548 RepID=UPI000E5A0AC0|nr:START domain-containing protein [Taibaiella koreensis]
MRRYTIFLFILLLCSGLKASAQSEWRFLTEKEGIKVYSKAVPGSKIKALKVECVLYATASALVTLLLDIPATVQWVSHTKSCVLLRQVSPAELYYYSEVNLPWPLENRDFVAHVKVSQDKISKEVSVNAPAIPGWVGPKKGIVRVSQSIGLWTISPLDKNRIKVSYSLQVDPGGVIPAWAVNALSSQGPIDSFIKMKQKLQLPVYKNAALDFIQN